MDEKLFQDAQKAYARGEFREAARDFVAAAGDETEGSGAALHQAANSLMRLRRYEDAAALYVHALDDESYDKIGVVAANLGAAHRAAGAYDAAIDAYDRALATDGYAAHHKAHMGKAGALYDMGRLEEASSAYRLAALDADNPDPGKALNNLGLTYVALGRPKDAVEAYRAAIGMEGYSGRGRASANMGLALAALGRTEEAAQAFDAAMRDFGYELPEDVMEVYLAASGSAPTQTPESPPEAPTPPSEPKKKRHVSSFFTRTDDEMRELDKKTQAEKKEGEGERNRRLLWLGAAGAAIVAVAALLAWAWLAGYGWPTQKAMVTGLLDAHAAGGESEAFWVAVPTADIEKEMYKLPANYVDYEVGAIESNAATSKVDVTIELDGGAPLRYEITLAREGVGWKVTGVENDWRSTGGGS